MGGVGEEGLLLLECGQRGSDGAAGEQVARDGRQGQQDGAAGDEQGGQISVRGLVRGQVAGHHDRTAGASAAGPGEELGDEA
ncbi:hypothetical protein [Kitasatospora sp. NPDC056531]|uniref:hypothetical protein n=1 Tax=Kitasatospora sp. NPDC056531 TaxID=3345856 RepID=UPI003688B4A9